jgi:hypothetical protein
MQPGAVAMPPDLDPEEGVLLCHHAYLFMAHETAPWERAEPQQSDHVLIS